MGLWKKKKTLKGIFGKKSKKEGVIVTNEKGYERILLNSHGKGGKYSKELSEGKAFTNSGSLYTDKNGEIRELTAEQRAYRHGYLAAQRDNANAYNSKNAPEKYEAYKAKQKEYRAQKKAEKKG